MRLLRLLMLSMLFRVVSVLIIPVLAGAQQTAGQPPPSGQQQGEVASRDSTGTFKVNVNVVNLYFVAKDKHGVMAPNLPQDQFEIFEDGKPQTIKYFKADASQPLTLGVLIDTSGSETRMLPWEQEVGAQFLNDVLREKDLAFLVSFDVNVDMLQDLTSSARDLKVAMRKTRINTGGGGGIPGMGGGPIPQSRPRGTLLYDAIYLASEEKLQREVGRKAIVILTDGEDEGSQTSLPAAIEAAQRADAIVYVLLIYDPSFANGANEMRRVCEQTGGRLIEVGNKQDKLKKALQQVSDELRSQYYIGYTPTNRKADGTFRKVELRPKNSDYRVQARKGYYAPKEN